MKFSSITKGIEERISNWESKLTQLDKDTISTKRNSQNRTIKQILGHLVDSCANNHHRIIRLQYNTKLTFPDYQQDNDLWIKLQDYQNEDWNNIIQLWKFYNIHMIQVIKSVDHSQLNNEWTNFEGNKVTLEKMIDGYLWHIDLHLDQIEELINK